MAQFNFAEIILQALAQQDSVNQREAEMEQRRTESERSYGLQKKQLASQETYQTAQIEQSQKQTKLAEDTFKLNDDRVAVEALALANPEVGKQLRAAAKGGLIRLSDVNTIMDNRREDEIAKINKANLTMAQKQLKLHEQMMKSRTEALDLAQAVKFAGTPGARLDAAQKFLTFVNTDPLAPELRAQLPQYAEVLGIINKQAQGTVVKETAAEKYPGIFGGVKSDDVEAGLLDWIFGGTKTIADPTTQRAQNLSDQNSYSPEAQSFQNNLILQALKNEPAMEKLKEGK